MSHQLACWHVVEKARAEVEHGLEDEWRRLVRQLGRELLAYEVAVDCGRGARWLLLLLLLQLGENVSERGGAHTLVGTVQRHYEAELARLCVRRR